MIPPGVVGRRAVVMGAVVGLAIAFTASSAQAIELAIAAAGAAITAGGASLLGFTGTALMTAASIGWSVGGFIGNMITAQGQKGPRGPRIQDRKVQSSAFGQPIADTWGTIRLAGHLTDSTDLIETKHKIEGGKGMFFGSPDGYYYTYHVDCMVMFARGPVAGILRIWADTKVIRDLSPDATLEERLATNLRLGDALLTIYVGGETQLPDAAMEALHGVGNVPAYRGLVYFTLKTFQLADFANRVPNFSAELFDVGELAPVEIYKWDLFQYVHDYNPAWDLNQTVWSGPDENGEIIVQIKDDRDSFMGYSGPNHQIVRCTFEGILPEQKMPSELDTFVDSFGYDGARVNGLLCHADRPVLTWWKNITRQRIYIQDWELQVEHVIINPFDSGSWVKPMGAALHGEEFFVYWQNTGTPLTDQLAKFSIPGGALLAVIENFLPAGDYIRDAMCSETYLYLLIVSGAGAQDGERIEYRNKTDLSLVGSIDITGLIYVKNLFVVDDSLIYVLGNYYLLGGPCTVYRIDNYGPPTEVITVDLTISPDRTDTTQFAVRGGLFYWGSGGETYGEIAIFGPTGASEGVPLMIPVGETCKFAGLREDQIDVSELTQIVDGYARPRQMTGRDVIDPLRTGYFFDAVESDGKLKFRNRGRASVETVPQDDLAAHEMGGEVPDRLISTEANELELPARVQVNYLQKDHEYEDGNQYDERLITETRTINTVELPMSLGNDHARQIAHTLMSEAWLTRKIRQFSLSRKYIELEPTDVIEIEVE